MTLQRREANYSYEKGDERMKEMWDGNMLAE